MKLIQLHHSSILSSRPSRQAFLPAVRFRKSTGGSLGRSLCFSVGFAGLACFFSGYASAQNIAGDTVQGNLTITGNATGAGWGLFKQGVDLGNNGEVMLNWWPGTTPVGTATFDINWADGTFSWRDTVTASTASNKMTLDAANSLTLYKSNGSAGILLNPESGKIILPAGTGTSTGSGIYFGSNTTATLAATSTGTAVFPSQVTLQSGLSVSSGKPFGRLNDRLQLQLQRSLDGSGWPWRRDGLVDQWCENRQGIQRDFNQYRMWPDGSR